MIFLFLPGTSLRFCTQYKPGLTGVTIGTFIFHRSFSVVSLDFTGKIVRYSERHYCQLFNT